MGPSVLPFWFWPILEITVASGIGRLSVSRTTIPLRGLQA
jgi:hypothetical protein